MKELKSHMYNAKVKDWMTKDITYVKLEDQLADIITRKCVLGAAIFIVKSKEGIVGLITNSDIYCALVREAYNTNSEKSKDADNIKVEDIMKGPPTKTFLTSCQINGPNPCLQTDENTTIGNAVRIMDKSGLDHILITGKNNELIGTISSNELIRSFCLGMRKKD